MYVREILLGTPVLVYYEGFLGVDPLVWRKVSTPAHTSTPHSDHWTPKLPNKPLKSLPVPQFAKLCSRFYVKGYFLRIVNAF